jgi:hypothetical protein
MTADGAPRISTGIVAAVLLLVAVYYGTDCFAGSITGRVAVVERLR